MNLIEAIRSGKPFDGESLADKDLVLWQDPDTGTAYLAKSRNWEDRRTIHAADFTKSWTQAEPVVTVTWGGFYEAYVNCLPDFAHKNIDRCLGDFMRAVGSKLGLEPR